MAFKVFVALFLGLLMVSVMVKSERLMHQFNLNLGIDLEMKGKGRLEPISEDQQKISMKVEMGRSFPTNAVGNSMKVNMAYADGKLSVGNSLLPKPLVLNVGVFGDEMAFEASGLMVIESENTFSSVLEIKHKDTPFASVDDQQTTEFEFQYEKGRVFIQENKEGDGIDTLWVTTNFINFV